MGFQKPGHTQLLLVDDDAEMLAFLKGHLLEKGYVVETARSGGEAIEKVRGKRYDIALMDEYDARRLVLHDGRLHTYD